MQRVLAEYIRKKRLGWLEYYLWMAPAVLLVLFFLVIPTFQTIRLSLSEELTFSEREFREAFMNELTAASGKLIARNDLIQDISGWEAVVESTRDKYQVQIGLDEIDEAMTVRDTVELLTATIYQARQARGGGLQFCGLKNYLRMFKDSAMLTAFKNNVIWLLFFTTFTVVLGLLIAALTDRVNWSTLAKTIIFLPMAISGAASAVIWNFMYFKDVNTGTVNALLNLVYLWLQRMNISSGGNFEGIAFLGRPDLVNLALIAAGVWMQVGFSTVIFSAALKSVPTELIEMAYLEGANAFQIFFKIEVPIIQSTIVLVITQMIMWVLKVFDIIYTLTQGGPFNSSEVIANRIYMTAFNQNNFPYASAMAVILFLAVIPVLLMNIRNLAYEETVRE